MPLKMIASQSSYYQKKSARDQNASASLFHMGHSAVRDDIA